MSGQCCHRRRGPQWKAVRRRPAPAFVIRAGRDRPGAAHAGGPPRLPLPMLSIASSIFLVDGAHAERHEQRDRGRPSGRAGHARLCRSRISCTTRPFGRANAAFQASQSPFVLRQTRLTHVLADQPGKHSIQRRVARGGCRSQGESRPGDRNARRRPGCGADRWRSRPAPRAARLAVLASQPSARARRSGVLPNVPVSVRPR